MLKIDIKANSDGILSIKFNRKIVVPSLKKVRTLEENNKAESEVDQATKPNARDIFFS